MGYCSVVYIVEVTNAQGVDLLNQDNQNAIDTSLIKAVYRGVEYKQIDSLHSSIQSIFAAL